MWINGKSGEGGHNSSGAADGTFDIRDVGPGTYTISAETLSKTDPLFGITTAEVHAENMDSLSIVLKPVPKLAAELRMNGGSVEPESSLVYFTRTDQITGLNMQIGHPDNDHRFTIPLIPGDYNLGFDAGISRLGIREVTLDGAPVTDWKIHIDQAPGIRKLVIILGSQALH